MKKLVIVVSGVSNRGKTKSIKKVVDLLQKKYPEGELSKSLQPTLTVDILHIFTVGNVKIGIASQGDSRDKLEEFFNKLIQAGSEIIVCACHTPTSATYRFIDALDRQKYDVVFIEKIGVVENERDSSNEATANEILSLIHNRLKP